jgi:hypothetical protein
MGPGARNETGPLSNFLLLNYVGVIFVSYFSPAAHKSSSIAEVRVEDSGGYRSFSLSAS